MPLPAVLNKLALSHPYRDKIRDANRSVHRHPTKAQQEAGNYRKGHVWMHGLGISIENAKNSTRSGVDKDGKPWSIRMKNSYGYIKRTESEADGDHVDVFLGDHPQSELVFVVNQNKPDGTFDEHKAMLGFTTQAEAKAAYLSNYSDDWKGFGSIVPITMADFKKWVFDGDTSRPFEKKAAKKHETCWSCGAKLAVSQDGKCDRCHTELVSPPEKNKNRLPLKLLHYHATHIVIRAPKLFRAKETAQEKKAAGPGLLGQVQPFTSPANNPLLSNTLGHLTENKDDGFLFNGLSGGNVANSQLALKQFQNRFSASQLGANNDAASLRRTLAGGQSLLGIPSTPATDEVINTTSHALSSVSPYAAMYTPGILDALHGSEGSTTLLGSKVQQAQQWNPQASGQIGLSPDESHQFTQAIAALTPTQRAGYTAGELAELYGHAFSQGLIAPNSSPQLTAQRLSHLAHTVRSVQDSGRLPEDTPIASLLQAAGPALLQQPASWVSQTALRNANLQEMNGVVPSRYQDYYAKSLAGAQNSQAANEMAAHIRAQEAGDPSLVSEFLPQVEANRHWIARLRLGEQVQKMQGQELANIMVSATQDPVAVQALFSLPPEVLAESDQHLNILTMMQAAPGLDYGRASRAWGQAERVAAQFGVPGASAMLYVHGPATQARAEQIRDYATQRADEQIGLAHLGRGGIARRLMDTVRSSPAPSYAENFNGPPPAGPDLQNIFYRAIGGVPNKDIQQAKQNPFLFQHELPPDPQEYDL